MNNGGGPILLLPIEHPDDGANGAFYEAERTGDWSYRADDPEEHAEVFDQEGASDLTDLTPLVDFLQFLNESSDEDFADTVTEEAGAIAAQFSPG